MSDTLWIRELAVRRIPGFPSGGIGLSALSPGINLIRGPNASGKTTLARAIQALLWRTADPGVSLVGRFQLDDHSWLVDLDGRHVRWQRDGQPASAPPLPPAESRSRYFLSLHELLRAADQDLAERIQIESAGGYDVSGAASSLEFGTRGRPRKLVDALGAAASNKRTALEEARALKDRRAELEELEKRLEKLDSEAARTRALERGLDLARSRHAETRARRRLDTFPEALASFGGQEVAQLDSWKSDEEQHRETLVDAQAQEREAVRRLSETDLGEDGVARAWLADLEKKVERARELERDVAGSQETLAAARAVREELDASLGGSPAGEDQPGADTAPTADDLRRLDGFLRRAGELRERRAELDARMREIDAATEAERDQAVGSTDEVRESLRLLRAWLRTEPADPIGSRRRDRLLLSASVLLLVLGLATVLLSVTSDPLTIPGVFMGGFSMIAGLVFLVLRPRSEVDPREGIERAAAALGHAPDSWNPEAVRQRVEQLEVTLAALRATDRRRDEKERLRNQREEMERQAGDLAEERTRLAKSTRLAPSDGDLPLYVLGTRLHARDKAARDETAARGRLSDLQQRLATLLEHTRERLGPYGYMPEDADALSAARSDLDDRRERHERATRDLEDARRRAEAAEAGLRLVASERERLWSRLGVDPDSGESEIRRLAARLDGYREAVDNLDGFHRDRKTAEKVLDEMAAEGDEAARALLEEAEDLDPEQLEAEGRKTEEAGRQAREVRKEVVRIEEALDRARRGHDVEEAIAHEEAARSELANQRSDDLAAEVGAALASWVRSRSSDHNRPAVFHRAQKLLARITRGRYRLTMSEGEPAAFRAHDTQTRTGHSLNELSAGTRLQLLLAVRIAFVETLESGAALPLLLDEVLANCDDHRARAIIDAAISLAEGGRQIFYFTAQADELAKWREVLEDSRVDWVERGLAGADASKSDAFDWSPRVIDPAVLPSPDGINHAEYGQALHVPPFDPWADGVGALHLWYLVDDPTTLHELLTDGISTWGQLDAFASTVGETSPVVAQAAKCARTRAAIARRLAQLHRRGRGRPVDRSTLLESGAVSETFIDEVSELCVEVEGNAALLVAGLREGRVAKFRSRKLEELRDFLLERGHLSEEPRLSDEEILLELTAEAHRLDPDLRRAEVHDLVTGLASGPSGPPRAPRQRR